MQAQAHICPLRHCQRIGVQKHERLPPTQQLDVCLTTCGMLHLESMLEAVLWCHCQQYHLPLSQTAPWRRCLADLRSAGDLSLRHASAQALSRFVEAARNAHAASADTESDHQAVGSGSAGLHGLPLVLHRVLMPAIKQSSADANLAVRQV